MDAEKNNFEIPPLDRLLAIEDIKRLKARYWRSLDLQEWDVFADTFAPDIVVDFREGTSDEKATDLMFPSDMREGIIRGADNWVEVVKKGKAARNRHGAISMHHGHMPEIDVLSATTAQGIWALEDMVFWPEKKTTHGFGFYDETYVKIDGAWKIQSMRLRRIRVAPIDGAA